MNETELGFYWDVCDHPDYGDDIIFIDGDNPVSLTYSDLKEMLESLGCYS